jgi:hypothetical protein
VGKTGTQFFAGLGRFASALCLKKAGKKVTNLKNKQGTGRNGYISIFL